jgi:hypothetical protein
MTSGPDQPLTTLLDRLTDRLRSLPDYRLQRPLPDRGGRSLGDETYRVARWCVVAEAGVLARDLVRPPELHPLPRINDLSCGDQLHVVVVDLLMALDATPGDAEVWLDEQRMPAAEVREELTDQLAELRSLS